MKTLKLEDFKANTKEWFLEQLGNMPASQAFLGCHYERRYKEDVKKLCAVIRKH